MAHHSSNDPLFEATQLKLMEQALNRTAGTDAQESSEATIRRLSERFGATGEFPEGQYVPHDEGAIRFGVAADEGKVFVDFGTPVRSLGLLPEQADALAQSLMEKARQARAQHQ